ncbi:hypothetical protein RM53_15585 [Brevundimonas nasdae]|uniref:DUF7946 domain-containing protein n=1 Tax=Brevundimonas nasdae TaxID=172043 RepID=A0A0B4DLH4_9CAUL|nr:MULTISPECIES: hypothetical protein [Brevundimonas]KIC55123.1 hypothetical protein RM53_15585 [Brevundimonas nasdae]
MSEATFSLAYDGDAVRDGEMDLADLGPALIGLSRLLKAAGKATYGDEASVTVKAKATREGSFEVLLSLGVLGAHAVWEFWKQPDVQAAATLLGLLGFTAKDGAIQAIKAMRGSRPKVQSRLGDGALRIETLDGTILDLPEPVFKLALDPGVREALEKVFVEPLERDGIDTVKIGDGVTTRVVVDETDADWFRQLPDTSDDQFVSKFVKPFKIVSLHFTSGRKWRLHDGRATRQVLIEDADFNGRVDRNEERFAKGDLLICEVEEVSVRAGSSFTSHYVIKKVLEHRPAPIGQPELDIGPDSPAEPS